MMRSFAGKLATFAALVGLVLVAVLAGGGYTLISTIRLGNQALSTYADELILAWSLQEAHERKLASGRGYLIAHDGTSKRDFETAAADTETVFARLFERVKSREGIELLDEAARGLRAHDQSLREVMAMNGSAQEIARTWATQVMPKASRAREAMNAFIRYKEKLHSDEKGHLYRAQQRAAWVMASTALAAIFVALLGGGGLLRSAGRTYAAEKDARAAAEYERRLFYDLLDQLPIGIVAAEPSGGIMHVSGLARRMLEEEDVPGAATNVVDRIAGWPAFRADGSRYPTENLPLARALRGEAVAQEEVRSAAERVYSVTAGPIRDESGKIIAAVVAFVDISERKRGERARELFIGALGHDLRNPLQSISLVANSLACRGDIPDVAKKPAARIASSAERMNQLISDLLDFARSQHGVIPIKPESCELREIAAEVIAEMKVTRPDRDIRVEAQGGCDGHWDRGRLVQVFQNLLVNAVEHGDAGSPIIVRTGCSSEHVWAEVTNRGDIPPEEQRRIFEPFRSRTTSRGLGLGLYIARALVEAHGGTIAVDCKNDETTFLIQLPIPVGAKAPPPEHRRSA